MGTSSFLGLVILAVVAVISLACLVLCIIALIDALKYPTDAYERAGKSQTASVALILGLMFIGFGIFGAAYHWFAVRPAVRQAAYV